MSEDQQMPLFEPDEKQLQLNLQWSRWALGKLVEDLFSNEKKSTYTIRSSYCHNSDIGCSWGFWRVDQVSAYSEKQAIIIAKGRWPQYDRRTIVSIGEWP